MQRRSFFAAALGGVASLLGLKAIKQCEPNAAFTLQEFPLMPLPANPESVLFFDDELLVDPLLYGELFPIAKVKSITHSPTAVQFKVGRC